MSLISCFIGLAFKDPVEEGYEDVQPALCIVTLNILLHL